MCKHCEDCIHYERCENCEDMDNHKHDYSNAIKPKEKSESRKANLYKVVKEIKNFGDNEIQSDVFNRLHPIGAIICVPYFEETKVFQDNKDCFELYEVKDLWELRKDYEFKSEKIQMTEEQFKKMIKDCYPINIDFNLIESMTREAKQKDYIIKSELQTLVEEADNIYVSFQKYKYTSDQNILSTDDKNLAWVHNACKVMSKQYETIEKLKESHPEFKK